METADSEPELQLLSNGGGVRNPRNLLRQLSASKFPKPAPESAPRCDIELSLELSLGGRFGMEKSPRNVLKKSASISFAPFLQSLSRDSESGAPIKRTISLPTGNTEKKRKIRDEVIGNPRLAKTAINGGCARTKGMMEEMPCVSTTGTGPNGRRIEGFLYRYSKREEVRIVCVCHGKFLSPAEFVKHAGGKDVDHPLKHIIVDPPRPCIS